MEASSPRVPVAMFVACQAVELSGSIGLPMSTLAAIRAGYGTDGPHRSEGATPGRWVFEGRAAGHEEIGAAFDLDLGIPGRQDLDFSGMEAGVSAGVAYCLLRADERIRIFAESGGTSVERPVRLHELESADRGSRCNRESANRARPRARRAASPGSARIRGLAVHPPATHDAMVAGQLEAIFRLAVAAGRSASFHVVGDGEGRVARVGSTMWEPIGQRVPKLSP